MAIEESYDENKADNYKNYLLENAEKFGFTAEKISQFENPVLVREVNQNLDAETLSEIIGSNEGGAELNPSEQAKSDADFIKISDFDEYNENSGGDLTAIVEQKIYQHNFKSLGKNSQTAKFLSDCGRKFKRQGN